MSYQAMTWATKCRVGDASEKLLLLTLANYSNEDGESWYSQERLSFDTEIPERTLRRKLQSLSEKGLIEVLPRRRDDGRKASSKIRLTPQPAKLAAGAIGQKEGSPPAKNGDQPSATWMAAQESSGNTQESKSNIRKKPKKVIAYTEEFERDIWGPYPMKAGTSKANAFKKWMELPDIEQQQVKTAIPVYARMEERKKFSHHLEFFVSRRIFETVGIIDGAAPVAEMDRNSWEIASRIYANSSNWHRQWGPEPGHPRCLMPPDLQQKFVGAHH